MARAGLATVGLAGLLILFQPTAVAADDTWNPFAEKDRRAAERRAERAREQQRQPGPAAQQPPYLAPMRPGDLPRYGNAAPPQPYPATPPGYGSDNPPYSPSGEPPSGAASYGAPGTYSSSPVPGAGSFGAGAAQPSVERGELTPVISSDNVLPAGTWQGLDAAGAEQLLGAVQLPPASPALNDLFSKVMAERVADPMLNGVRSVALFKAGRFELAARLLVAPSPAGETGRPADLLFDLKYAQLELVNGNTERGCAAIKQAVAAQAKLPKHARGEAVVLAGYCAIVSGNARAGGLAAELARDSGYNRPFTIALLEAIANGESVRAPLPRLASVIDGLLILRLKSPDPALIEGAMANASAGFLQLIATDTKIAPALRLKAAERAASANITSPSNLAEAYRAAASAPQGATGAAFERARQFVAAEQQLAQFGKTRAIRGLLDSAMRDGMYHPVAVAIAPIVRAMRPAQEISWFTETAVETLVAGGDYATARNWLRAAASIGGQAGSLDHWLMLIDIADPEVNSQDRGRSLALLENLAMQGRFSQPALHRLATVLDALDYNIPIPLWNLASRTQQPQTGHLPATGILSAMKQASEARQIAATMLYALHTIASAGTGATHLLGLGDTIRALKRSGLERDARRLGFEALFADWPRTGGG